MILYGVFNAENNLIAVHATEQGANENKATIEKNDIFERSYYVDFVVVHN